MAFRVRDAAFAYKKLLALGAKPFANQVGPMELNIPAIEGIGGRRDLSRRPLRRALDLRTSTSCPPIRSRGFAHDGAGLTDIDHVTHNVFRGNMDKWAGFYETLFNFRQIRYFDIEGRLTGLKSRAMTSPDGKIRIPINESSDDKSQIAEYLHLYKGEGIQHIALGTSDIYESVETLRTRGVAFQDTPDTYYERLDNRIKGHGEDVPRLKRDRILMDGEHDGEIGLLLQIFTQNAIGPIFFEVIQRKGNEGFGEGNFKALFESIEADQVRRGVLQGHQVMSSKNWIEFPRVEGKASRQAHADLPEGTYEREIGRDGFFGPATHVYHRHPPTGWIKFEGPLRPRAFDAKAAAQAQNDPFKSVMLLSNASCQFGIWRLPEAMPHLVRNADGDLLLFIHAGEGDLFCDFGHLTYREGDYLLLPRGTMWRLTPTQPTIALVIEATNGAYKLPERGILGPHAFFDPAALDTPKLDDAFEAQANEAREWTVRVKRRNQMSTITYPWSPLDAVGWKGNLTALKLNWRDIRPDHEPPLSHSAIGALDLRRRPLRGLHLRAASDRERSRRAEGAVLSFQRRLRRGDLLSPGRVLQPRQHPSRHGDVAPQRLHARPASQSLRRRRQGRQDDDGRGRSDDRRARSARHRARGRSGGSEDLRRKLDAEVSAGKARLDVRGVL